MALVVVERGNINSLSDSGVAGLTASAAAEGALYNVMINLDGIEDAVFAKDLATRAKLINSQVQEGAREIKKLLYSGLKIES